MKNYYYTIQYRSLQYHHLKTGHGIFFQSDDSYALDVFAPVYRHFIFGDPLNNTFSI